MSQLPFSLIRALTSHFFRRDQEINTGGRDIDTAGGDVITGAGTVDGVDVSTHAADPDAHHTEAHVHTHASLSSVTANQHHNQVHALDGGDHTGSLPWGDLDLTGADIADIPNRAHGSLQTVTANQHHNQVHAIGGADHTGNLDSRYYTEAEHSSDVSGGSEAPLKSGAAGGLAVAKLGVGTSAPSPAGDIVALGDITAQDDLIAQDTVFATNHVNVGGNLLADGGLGIGDNTQNPSAGTILMTGNAKMDGGLTVGNRGGANPGGGSFINIATSMGNGSDDPTSDPPVDWLEVEIGGANRYVPVYN